MKNSLNKIVNRPWGNFKTIHIGDSFTVKILTIYPNSQISLQYHKNRSEHWIITKGIANITKGDQTFILKENEVTFIKKEEIHRIENKEKFDLVIVEVQIGEKISENDIVRLDDIYGRVPKNK